MTTAIRHRPGHIYQNGYIKIWYPDHLHAVTGYVFEHDLIAENALGHYLPDKVVVHHHDGTRDNNANSNLIICENQSYHLLLHQRLRVFRAGGDPDTQKFCMYCKRLKPVTIFGRCKSKGDGLHQSCKPCRQLEHRNRKRSRIGE